MLPVNEYEKCEDGWVIVSDDMTLTYGYGESLADAMADYETSLAELAEMLERDSEPHPLDVELLKYIKAAC